MAALLELLEPWVASQTLKMPKVMALKTELFLKGDQSLPDLLGCHLVYLWEYLWGISIYIYIYISVGDIYICGNIYGWDSVAVGWFG